jgi:hypoxanthine phosphoribosyltransferase
MYNDLEEILLSEEAIFQRVDELGQCIAEEYRGRNLFVLSVLKGSVIFLADIIRAIPIPLEFGFITISTYQGSTCSQRPPEVLYHSSLPSLEHKDVLLVEDILDTGSTLRYAVDWVKSLGASSVKTCVLVAKEGYESSDFPRPDFLGFTLPNKFLVGYGLDYRERYRNLCCIGVLKKELCQSTAEMEEIE